MTTTHPLQSDLDTMLPLSLLRVREVFMERIRPILAAADISEAQWRVLRVLDMMGPTDFGEVASLAVLQRSSLSRIVKELTSRGWVDTVANPGDARRMSVSITADGSTQVASLFAPISEAYAAIANEAGDPALGKLRTALAEFHLAAGVGVRRSAAS